MFSPDQQIGSYILVRRLGRGGFGEVWLAERRMKFVTTKVALKLPLDSEIDYEEIKQEALIWERASGHPNVVPIIEADECDGQAMVVSEYIDGGSLDQVLDKCGGAFSADEAVRVAVGVLSGLAFLHSRGIIHRDVKPANILLQGDTPRLIDFGVSRIVKGSAASLKSAGTPHYMAPEAFDGKRNAQTDIWAAGVVLYEMLTGTYPFRADGVMEIMGAILSREPAPLPPEIDPHLRLVIARALKKEPAERYRRAEDMRRELHGLIFKTRTDFDFSLHETVADAPASPITTSFSDNQKKSIAILPFTNLSGDPSVQFYEFSLADAVTTELARLRSLTVRPSSMIARYQGKSVDPCDAGREMLVNSVLACGFMSSGTRLRVTAQLLDVATREIIWSDRIDGDSDDIFALQDMIANQIIKGLDVSLSTGEQAIIDGRPTRSSAAYEEYLRARDKHARFMFVTTSLTDCDSAIHSFTRATQLDPEFALAWSGLGSCYANKVFKGMGDTGDYELAEEAFKRAIALDPEILEARALMCFVEISRGEKNKAREQLRVLYGKFPESPPLQFCQAVMHRLDGDYDSALACLDKLELIDPASRIAVQWHRGRLYSQMGQHDRALKEIEAGLAIEPNHPVIRIIGAQVLFHAGDTEKALSEATATIAAHPHFQGLRAVVAMMHAARNEPDEAIKNLTPAALKNARADMDIAYWTAQAYAQLGRSDDAIEWLEQSIKLGLEDRKLFENDKMLESLRSEKRFVMLIQKLQK